MDVVQQKGVRELGGVSGRLDYEEKEIIFFYSLVFFER